MSVFSYIKKNGLKKVFQVIWQYKLDLLFQKVILPFVMKKPLEDTIIIESHNDFDCNGGAFYQYLVDNGYNQKYKIVWLVKHPGSKPNHLPSNVECFPLFAPSFKKSARICTAKYFLADNVVTPKMRAEQMSIFLGHGTGGLKNIKGLMNFDNSIDYILIQSKTYAPIQAEQYGLENAREKMVFLGYPGHDELFKSDNSELKKVTDKAFQKVILWMPTFRKTSGIGGYTRVDSEKEQKLGIPLLKSNSDYERLNAYLAEKEILLIIKLHPMQDLSGFGLKDCSNIIILTGETVKKRNIDNYRLMRCADAMISDYSGAAYEYLQLDRPIAYVLDDLHEYKRGFVVEDIHTLLAGNEIYNFQDLKNFLRDVSDGIDMYKEKRGRIRDYIYEYHDDQNCKRLAEFMGL